VVATREAAPILGGLIQPAHFTTVLILLINAALFAATLILSPTHSADNTYVLVTLGAKFGPEMVQNHQWWRLVSAGFLHGGWLHILMNSWTLYGLGAMAEQIYGTPRFLVIYFVGTVVGFYLSFQMSPMVVSIGASAGITGLIGAMIAWGVANRSRISGEARNMFIQWVIYIVIIGTIPGVDNYAHIGGFVGGFGIGWLAGTPVVSAREREAMWRVLAAVCVLITLYCFLMVYLHFGDQIG
jgi:rhomboid protease GluP